MQDRKRSISVVLFSRLRLESLLDGISTRGTDPSVLTLLSFLFSILTVLCYRTLARAKELEAKEREDIRNSLEQDHAAHRPHESFSEDPDVNKAATTLARDEEERVGFHDFDDDNVDIVIDDDSEHAPSPKKAASPYHDEFTDNDSDIFRDGDESEGGETYRLHTHVRSNPGPTSK